MLFVYKRQTILLQRPHNDKDILKQIPSISYILRPEMQAFLYLLPVLAIFAPTSATPTRSLERQASLCGEQDTESTGAFTLSTDEWGESSGTGSQCAQINSYDDGSLAWSTTWSWADNMNNVKAFTNVQSSSTYCEQISAISSIPTSWSWR